MLTVVSTVVFHMTVKTTLLSLISGLTNPTQGEVLYQGRNLADLDRYRYRSHDIGVVFQSFNLLPGLTVAENIILSMDASGRHYPSKKQRAVELLERVHLPAEYANERILHLSGGEQQRVAIARAFGYAEAFALALLRHMARRRMAKMRGYAAELTRIANIKRRCRNHGSARSYEVLSHGATGEDQTNPHSAEGRSACPCRTCRHDSFSHWRQDPSMARILSLNWGHRHAVTSQCGCGVTGTMMPDVMGIGHPTVAAPR